MGRTFLALLAAVLSLACSFAHAQPTAKLAMGGSAPPAFDLAALDVEYVEFQKGWNTVAGNEVDVNGNSLWPQTLDSSWIRRQFQLPVRGSKIIVWDIEGTRFDGIHATTGGAGYERDIAWTATMPATTRSAIPGHKIWLYNPFYIWNDGGINRDANIARVASGHALLSNVDGAGMSGYSLYKGPAPHPTGNGPRDAWWSAQGETMLKRLREGTRAFKLAHKFCWPEPETIIFITGLDIGDPAKGITPDSELIALIRAAIEGGANRVCYWDATPFFWRLPTSDPKVVAEHKRVIRCMRIAAGYPAIEEPPATQPEPPPTTGRDFGDFAALPSVYVTGESGDLEFVPGADFPRGAWVVFQTWAGSVVAAHPDREAPFVYPASALAAVPAGRNSLQAIVRLPDRKVAQINRTMFFAAGSTIPTPPPPPTDPQVPTDAGSAELIMDDLQGQTIENRTSSGAASGILVNNGQTSSGNTIRDCDFLNVQRYGWYAGDCRNWTVESCDFTSGDGAREHGWRFPFIVDSTVRDCTLDATKTRAFSVWVIDGERLLFENNHIKGKVVRIGTQPNDITGQTNFQGKAADVTFKGGTIETTTGNWTACAHLETGCDGVHFDAVKFVGRGAAISFDKSVKNATVKNCTLDPDGAGPKPAVAVSAANCVVRAGADVDFN